LVFVAVGLPAIFLVNRPVLLATPEAFILSNLMQRIPNGIRLEARVILAPSGCKEGHMTRLLLRNAILGPILIVAVPLLISVALPSPALAQHPHPGAPVHTGVAPRAPSARMPARASTSPPRVFPGPHPVGVGSRGIRFRQRPITIFRPRLFLGAPFVRSRFFFNSPWSGNCAPYLGWGIDCYPSQLYGYGYGFENYVTVPAYESPVYEYEYGGENRDLIFLYRKDGTVYSVTDYWFANGDLHLMMLQDGRESLVEHVIPSGELDLKKTIEDNTARGFRIVQRDEPWQQYQKDHPDLTPPPLQPPQN
jgi:hypothetical protein